VSHPALGAYEAPLGTGPPASRQSDQGESRTPKPVRARRSERRVSTSCTTWPVTLLRCLSLASRRRELAGASTFFPPIFFSLLRVSDPCGNRTRLCGLRGRRPVPIDERADCSSVFKLTSASGRSRTCIADRRVGYSHLGAPMPSRRDLLSVVSGGRGSRRAADFSAHRRSARQELRPPSQSVARVGVEPTNSRRFELRRFAGLRTVPLLLVG
jgi:hypothetical protein